VPNGGKRNKREAARLKRMGVRAGVHDYFLPVPMGIYHGLWVELKPDVKGYYPSVSDKQREWRTKMRDRDYAAFVVKGWERAIFLFETYLKLDQDMEMLLPGGGEFDMK